MTPEKLKSIFQKYAQLLPDNQKQLREGGYDDQFYTLMHHERESHVAWMCQEAQTFVDQKRIEKAMRWLGFVQGYLWARSMRTLDELKTDSMPDKVDVVVQKLGLSDFETRSGHRFRTCSGKNRDSVYDRCLDCSGNICEGGLGICKLCNQAEGELEDECPKAGREAAKGPPSFVPEAAAIHQGLTTMCGHMDIGGDVCGLPKDHDGFHRLTKATRDS